MGAATCSNIINRQSLKFSTPMTYKALVLNDVIGINFVLEKNNKKNMSTESTNFDA